MARRYYFGVVRFAPGEGFVATFPDLPDFTVTGKSVDEVREIAEQRLTRFLREMSDNGKEIPLPQTERYTTFLQDTNETRILVSGDIPNETPLLLILRNAKRLYGEANLLFRSGSMASAVALSIAAIEEAGKFMIYSNSNRTVPKKGRADHQAKQRVLGEAFEKMFLFEALAYEAKCFEEYLSGEGETAQRSEFLSMPEKEKLRFVYSMLSNDKGKLRRLVQRRAGPEEHSINYNLDVNRNKVSEKREQALYVDIRDGKLLPSPFEISFDEACEWLERAEFAVFVAESFSKMPD